MPMPYQAVLVPIHGGPRTAIKPQASPTLVSSYDGYLTELVQDVEVNGFERTSRH